MSKTRCVLMVGPDVQMDQRGSSYEPANALPAKCSYCTFPDLDFVANPYLLTKGVSSPAETSPAQLGNFLVRERVRHILELAVPDACTFHRTADAKSKKAVPWSLAVPNHHLPTPVPKPNPPFCPRCHESREWRCAMRAVWEEMKTYDSGGIDIFKSLEWFSFGTYEQRFEEESGQHLKPLSWSDWLRGTHCRVGPPAHAGRWTRTLITRDLYFSVRLEQLLMRAKVKGQLTRALRFSASKPSLEDGEWIQEKLKLLAKHDLIEAQPCTDGNSEAHAARRWFRQFVARNTRTKVKKFDFTAVETKHRLVLPKDYKDFISIVGSMSFEKVMETEGFTARVLPPTKIDFKGYRRGSLPELDEEQSQIDGVMFASTEHGDAFVFDVSAKDTDYQVFWHDHEQNTLEPFAANFAECVKRFAKRN